LIADAAEAVPGRKLSALPISNERAKNMAPSLLKFFLFLIVPCPFLHPKISGYNVITLACLGVF
jgi:hypothetical protein